MSREWRLYSNDILKCCEKVRRFTAAMTQVQFLADERTYDAVLRNLEIIGEAAKNIPPEIRRQMPNIEWQKIIGMRDWLAHAYFGIEDKVLWDVIQNKVPKLEQMVQAFEDSGPK